MEVGKTDTEGGPLVGREHREEVVDRRTVSTTHKHATDRVKRVTQTRVQRRTTQEGGKTLKTDAEGKDK